jgi:hypothetical protein
MYDFLFYFFFAIGIAIPSIMLGQYLIYKKIIKNKVFYVGKKTYKVVKTN